MQISATPPVKPAEPAAPSPPPGGNVENRQPPPEPAPPAAPSGNQAQSGSASGLGRFVDITA